MSLHQDIGRPHPSECNNQQEESLQNIPRYRFSSELARLCPEWCPDLAICPEIQCCPEWCPNLDSCPEIQWCPNLASCPEIQWCPNLDSCPATHLSLVKDDELFL